MAAPLFETNDRARAEAFSALTWCNPFNDERVALERAALGEAWQQPATGVVWLGGVPVPPNNPNITPLAKLAEQLATTARERLRRRTPTARERILYHNLGLYTVFHRYEEDFHRLIQLGRERGAAPARCAFYERYRNDLDRWFPADQPALALEFSADRIFASFYQVRRAYAHINEFIIGTSVAARRLRARVWQSIFTRDTERFVRALTGKMAELVTLVTGPSGSGKELVARAIGLSRHVPFDGAKREFAEDYLRSFYPINLAALSPTLIESELFGHRRGAFTGALADRQGYLEACGQHGTVFLDEIGETEPTIQVKLLRVLQTRVFQRIGDTEPRTFAGKIIAATNRDLAGEMRAGRFRPDLYYRLCADHVQTPALSEILRDAPGELNTLVHHVAAKIAGPDEAATFTEEACAALQRCLPPDYAWPGNFRELEQAVRNILVHGDYVPEGTGQLGAPPANGAGQGGAASASLETPEGFALALAAGELTADTLLRNYIQRVHGLAGSYEEAARRLGLDRRTVKKYLRETAPG